MGKSANQIRQERLSRFNRISSGNSLKVQLTKEKMLSESSVVNTSRGLKIRPTYISQRRLHPNATEQHLNALETLANPKAGFWKTRAAKKTLRPFMPTKKEIKAAKQHISTA